MVWRVCHKPGPHTAVIIPSPLWKCFFRNVLFGMHRSKKILVRGIYIGMDGFLEFVEETKDSSLMFGAVLAIVTIGGVAKSAASGFWPTTALVVGLIGLVVVLGSFGTSLIKFIAANPAALISASHSHVRPNIGLACVLCFSALCLFLYGAYVLSV